MNLTDLMRDKYVKIKWRPMMEFVEIELTTACNLRCKGCDRFCDSFPSNDHMPIEMVDKFVDETVRLRYKWKKIAIMGGEPFLHPQIDYVLKKISPLSKWVKRIQVVTNGLAKQCDIPENIKLVNTKKISRHIKTFDNMLQAPIDRGKRLYSCKITTKCGLGYGVNGYFCCGCAGAIDRVLNTALGIKDLRNVTEKAMIRQLRLFCGVCGQNLNCNVTMLQDSSPSQFWESVLKNAQHRNSSRALSEGQRTKSR